LHKRTVGLILTGILATGAAGAVVITPASATTSDNVVTSRLAGIKSALSGLVTDGTLTQSQADKVAGTLDSKLPKHRMGGMGGPGGHMGGMGMGMGMRATTDAAAKALGMTTAKLHTALQSGKSLADIAKGQKVSVDALVKAMVASAQGQLTAAVKDGSMTQAQANTMKSFLSQRITDRVNGVRPDRGRMHGPHGAEVSPPTVAPSGATSGATTSIPLGTV
jgi:hypothetical protein